MTSSQNRSDTSPRRAVSPSPEDLDRVRDILFGEHAQQLEQELADIREEVASLRTELRTETNKREEAVRKAEQAIETIRGALDKVRDDSVDRSQFASLLQKLASEVKQTEKPRRRSDAAD